MDVLKPAAEFNEKIIGLTRPSVPTPLDRARRKAIADHLREEAQEFEDADELKDQVDALTDVMFIASGRFFETGTDGQAHYAETSRANRSRVRGNNAKRPGSFGFDAVKPDGWQEPNHQAIIDNTIDGRLHAFGGPVQTREEQVDQFFDWLDTDEPLGSMYRLDLNPHRSIAVEHPKLLRRALDKAVFEGTPVLDEEVAVPGHPPYHHLGEEASLDLRTRKPKIILLGHARHGKDTVAEMLRDKYGFSFESSSMFCAEKVMMPYFNGLPNHPGYASVEDCYADRVNYRDVWFQQIELYNYPDRSRLAREMFEANDVYVGMRSKRELAACVNAGLADLVIWVDASDRLPPEDASSCTVEPWMAQLTIDNNGTLEELAFNVHQLVEGYGL